MSGRVERAPLNIWAARREGWGVWQGGEWDYMVCKKLRMTCDYMRRNIHVSTLKRNVCSCFLCHVLVSDLLGRSLSSLSWGGETKKNIFRNWKKERELQRDWKKNIPSHADLHYYMKPSLESHQTPCSLFQIWLLKKHSWKPNVFLGSISHSLCSLFTKVFITTGN